MTLEKTRKLLSSLPLAILMLSVGSIANADEGEDSSAGLTNRHTKALAAIAMISSRGTSDPAFIEACEKDAAACLEESGARIPDGMSISIVSDETNSRDFVVTDSEGQSRKYSFDANGKLQGLSSQMSSRGTLTQSDYDAFVASCWGVNPYQIYPESMRCDTGNEVCDCDQLGKGAWPCSRANLRIQCVNW